MQGPINSHQPLVSVMIPNYNHSRYLDECISSVENQTYSNIEIILLDNQSEDHSLETAQKHQSGGIKINRNICNTYNTSYRILSEQLAKGEFLLLMGADDFIHPEFIEKAIHIMTKYPNVGYVHGERNFVDELGVVTELDPFFNCSFVAPGSSIMPIYMVTTIAHPAQGIIRRSAFEKVYGYQREVDHMNADKSLWFYLSAISDYAYIREKMCNIRFSVNNQTTFTQNNFQHPLLCHMIINEFLRFAEQFGFTEVIRRKSEALQRLSKDFIIYAGGMLLESKFEKAWSYLSYARIVNPEIVTNDLWGKLMHMYDVEEVDLDYVRSTQTMFHARKRCYSPPAGFQCLDMEIK